MKVTEKDAVTRAIQEQVFDKKTPLEQFFATYEEWAIKVAQVRYPTTEGAARALGMSRRQFMYRLRRHGLIPPGDFPIDEKGGSDGDGVEE